MAPRNWELIWKSLRAHQHREEILDKARGQTITSDELASLISPLSDPPLSPIYDARPIIAITLLAKESTPQKIL